MGYTLQETNNKGEEMKNLLLRKYLLLTMAACALIFAVGSTARADTDQAGPAVASDDGMIGKMIENWLNRVSEIQAEQPHWVTPLATVTPRLEQELRYDQFWASKIGNQKLNSYGGGKGVELIPFQNTEVILGIPAYQTRNKPNGTDGFADENLLFKYRLLSANEKNGNYILTAFLGLSLPTGSDHNTANHVVTTPTLAFGKGWGNFDIQGTLGVQIPDNGSAPTGSGTPVVSNATFQYRTLKYASPEVELNYTYWPNGARAHMNQLYITPGIVLGKFDLWKRVGATVGVGCQIAVTDESQNNHNVILSVRVPF
jgi:hypothetical protein